MSPLAGKSVLVTRAKAQAAGLVAELESLGARVYAIPAIEIRPPDSTLPLDDALCILDSYDWLVLTSVNAVNAVVQRMKALGIPMERLMARKLAAVGPATAEALVRVARQPDLIPAEYVSEGIAEALAGAPIGRFLLPQADLARKDLGVLLRAQGHHVDEVVAYRIVRGGDAGELPQETPDYITLTSPSSAQGTFEILKANGREDWMGKAGLVCIGPITSAAVRELGYEVAAEAEEYTATGLTRALVRHARLSGERVHA